MNAHFKHTPVPEPDGIDDEDWEDPDSDWFDDDRTIAEIRRDRAENAAEYRNAQRQEA